MRGVAHLRRRRHGGSRELLSTRTRHVHEQVQPVPGAYLVGSGGWDGGNQPLRAQFTQDINHYFFPVIVNPFEGVIWRGLTGLVH